MGRDDKRNFKGEMSLDLYCEENADFSWAWRKDIKYEQILKLGHTQEYFPG